MKRQLCLRPRNIKEDNIKMDVNIVRGYELDISDSVYGQVTGCCEYGNEISKSTKLVRVFDELSNCQVMKKNSHA